MISVKYYYNDFINLMQFLEKHTNGGYLHICQNEKDQLEISAGTKMGDQVTVIIYPENVATFAKIIKTCRLGDADGTNK